MIASYLSATSTSYVSRTGAVCCVGRGYARIGKSVQPMRSKARAGIALEVSVPQQFIDQAIAFAPAGVNAYADCRTTDPHVWGGLPKDLASHVLQHPQGLVAHLPNTLRHQGLRAPSASL